MTVRPILMTVSAVAVVLLLLMITSRAIDGQKQHRLRRQTTGGRPLGGIVADNDAAAADDDTNSGGRVISAAPIGLVSGQPPQQIGQIEFDVEVEEEQLKDGQQAPRVDIVGSRKGSENLDKTGGNRVITGIPVEMASERTKLGDIELDMDITDKSKSYRKSKRPELVVHPKAEQKTTGSGVDGGSDGLQTSTAADDELDSLLKLAANNIDNNGDDANGAADNESDSDVKLAAHMPDNDAKGQPLSSSSVTKPRFRDLITPNLFTFTSDDVINTTTSGYGGGDQSANTDAPPVIDTTIGSTKSGAAAAAITLVTTTTTLPLIGRLLAIVWPIVMLLSALFSYI